MAQGNFFVECVIATSRELLAIGWLDDTGTSAKNLLVEHGGHKTEFCLDGPNAVVACIRTFRLDVHRALELSPDVSACLGFVLAVPLPGLQGQTVSLSFDVTETAPQVITALLIDGSPEALVPLLPHSGHALRELAFKVGALDVGRWIDSTETQRFSAPTRQLVAVDCALMLAGCTIIVHGWIGASVDSVNSMRVTGNGIDIDVSGEVIRTYRPDLFGAFPELAPNPLGFLFLLDSDKCASALELSLLVEIEGSVYRVRFVPEAAHWIDCLTKLCGAPHLRSAVMNALSTNVRAKTLPGYNANIAWLARESFNAMAQSLPKAVFSDSTTHAAVDRALICGASTLVVNGWHLQPIARLVSIRVCSSDGSEVEVADRMHRYARSDVTAPLKLRFPHLNEHCGFLLCLPVSQSQHAFRALRFELDNGAVEWLQLRPDEVVRSGGAFLQILNECLGDLRLLRGGILQFFELGFGPAVERLVTCRSAEVRVSQRQFGTPPLNPPVSVIVPLLGRSDLLRHQLAHFADDRDFANLDLIYVVDDPSILVDTVALAAHYAALFGVPFRVVHYAQNLGFAGAINVGARLARAETLLLLNSDVLPKSPGWTSALIRSLGNLPDAVAVGPLLLFQDGSVQHGGVAPLTDPARPGPIWNSHGGKGAPWSGGHQPVRCSALTTACLMVRTADYQACGGLDEGYFMGEFEDADLCLKLRKSGRKLWLVPGVQLWHLELESPKGRTVTAQPRATSLYDGWRFQTRIERGELADPFTT